MEVELDFAYFLFRFFALPFLVVFCPATLIFTVLAIVSDGFYRVQYRNKAIKFALLSIFLVVGLAVAWGIAVGRIPIFNVPKL